MKNIWLGYLLLWMLGLPALAQAQDTGYQAGKIVNVERQADTAVGGGTDTTLKAEEATYKISVQVKDTVYLVRHHAGDQDLSWIQGKDVQVKVAGKKMYVKRASGTDAKAGILSMTKASMP